MTFLRAASLFLAFQAIAVAASASLTVHASYDSSAYPDTTVQFFYIANPDDLYHWNWDFGDGNTSVQGLPQHIYTQQGTYTVRLDAWSFGSGQVSAEVEVHIYNTAIADDFESLSASLGKWHWPDGSELEENYVVLDGDGMLAFPILRAQTESGGGEGYGRTKIPDNQDSSSPLICIEPPGPDGEPPDPDRDTIPNPKGLFRFDMILDAEGLPNDTKLVFFRLNPLPVTLSLQYSAGQFAMQARAGSAATAWEPVNQGQVYRVEVDFERSVPGEPGRVEVRWTAQSPGLFEGNTETRALNGLTDMPGWYSADFGAFEASALGFDPPDSLGGFYLNNVAVYRYADPSAD